MEPIVKIELHINDVNVIIAALRKLPWDVADPALRKLDAQIRKNISAPKAESAPAGKRVKKAAEQT